MRYLSCVFDLEGLVFDLSVKFSHPRYDLYDQKDLKMVLHQFQQKTASVGKAIIHAVIIPLLALYFGMRMGADFQQSVSIWISPILVSFAGYEYYTSRGYNMPAKDYFYALAFIQVSIVITVSVLLGIHL